MKGFILAAGFGQRMLPLTETVPKPLLPVGHLPLIAYSIKLLAHHGITDIIVNLHHLPEAVQTSLGDGSRYGVNITYSIEEEILGTGGGLKHMHELLDETFVVINSDIVVDCNLSAAIAEHQQRGALATMVLKEPPENSDLGRICVDSDGRIQSIKKEGHGAASCHNKEDDSLRYLMFTGIHIIEPRFLEYIPMGIKTCVVHYGYNKALHNKELLRAHVISGLWLDAGTPERFLVANRMALARQLNLPHADPLTGYALTPRRDVADVVRLGEDVNLGDHVALKPAVVIGDSARIGERCVIGPLAVIGDGVVMGKEVQMVDSVVLDGAKVEPYTRLAHCIVGRRAKLVVHDS